MVVLRVSLVLGPHLGLMMMLMVMLMLGLMVMLRVSLVLGPHLGLIVILRVSLILGPHLLIVCQISAPFAPLLYFKYISFCGYYFITFVYFAYEESLATNLQVLADWVIGV